MDIPDRLSDMDSVPDTLSLSRRTGKESMEASLWATIEDACDDVIPAFVRATEQSTEALRRFSAALEIAELNSLYNK